MGTRCADHVTPLYPQKLALTSPIGGGRSVGIVRSRTKATEFSLSYIRISTTSLISLKNVASAAEVMVVINFGKLKVVSQLVIQEVQNRSLLYISSK